MTADRTIEALRGDSEVPFIPAFEPRLYRSFLCDHDALPEWSVCGICGFRTWLTSWEESHGIRVPLTSDAMMQWLAGELNLSWHRDLVLCRVDERDSELDRAARVRRRGGSATLSVGGAAGSVGIPGFIRAQQKVVDIFCAVWSWDWNMFDDEQVALIERSMARIDADYGKRNTYGWALCIGALIPPPADWGWQLPAWDNCEMADEYKRDGRIPPRGRRMDCLIALNYMFLSWVSRWSW